MIDRTNPDTREKLIEAGIAAFLENGYHGTGLKQVLDAAGVPKGSFYNYFDSKEAFGAAAIDQYAADLADTFSASMRNASDPVDGLRRFFEHQMGEFKRARFSGGCLVANLGGEVECSPKCRDALSSALKKYQGAIAGKLAEAQDAGLVRSDIPAAALANLLVDAWEGAVIRMKIEHSLTPLEDCLKHTLFGFFKG